jgi:hypothetical protein
MKQTLMLTAIAVIFSSTVSAQIKKGSILLGGQISYFNAKTNNMNGSIQTDQKEQNAFFNIAAGTAIKDNKVIGLIINYGHLSNDYLFNNNTNTYFKSRGNQYGADVFYRHYKTLAKNFYFFGEAAAGYLGSSITNTDIPTNTVTKNASSSGRLYVSPGVAYRIYKKLQVELVIPEIAGVSYTSSKNTDISNGNYTKQNNFRFVTNLNSSLLNNLGLGFKFVL